MDANTTKALTPGAVVAVVVDDLAARRGGCERRLCGRFGISDCEWLLRTSSVEAGDEARNPDRQRCDLDTPPCQLAVDMPCSP
jgi:hypothetical protein